YKYSDVQHESCIKANKAGLQLFAATLLQASIDSKKIIEDKEKNIITLHHDAEWIDFDSDTFINYIEPIGGTRTKPVDQPIRNRFKEETFKIGCIVIFIFIAVCCLTGFVIIVKNLF
ncbi:MAG: hypothetical protein ACHQII_04125, partial [Bacteroidia bacterium]